MKLDKFQNQIKGCFREQNFDFTYFGTLFPNIITPNSVKHQEYTLMKKQCLQKLTEKAVASKMLKKFS